MNESSGRPASDFRRARAETGPSPPAPHAPLTADQVFRKYYKENDIFVSAEGMLKVIAIVGCIVSSAVFVSGGAAGAGSVASCAGAPGLAASAATVALVSAAVTALLYAGVALHLPLRAPQAWLYTDIITSSVVAVVMLLAGVLSIALCDRAVLNHIRGALAMCISGIIIAGTVTTYTSAMRQWDAGAGPAREPPPPPPPPEHDV